LQSSKAMSAMGVIGKFAAFDVMEAC